MELSWNEMVLFSEILNGEDFPSGKQRHLLSWAPCSGGQGTTLQRGLGLFAPSHPDPTPPLPPDPRWNEVQKGQGCQTRSFCSEFTLQNSSNL